MLGTSEEHILSSVWWDVLIISQLSCTLRFMSRTSSTFKVEQDQRILAAQRPAGLLEV